MRPDTSKFRGFLTLMPFLSLSLVMSSARSWAESPAEAIRRIRSGPHMKMPAPQMIYTSGPTGKGMTIRNQTAFLLRVHFSGVSEVTVVVPPRESLAVGLFVGQYQVAAEASNERVLPFYGIHDYLPRRHYILSFAVKRIYR